MTSKSSRSRSEPRPLRAWATDRISAESPRRQVGLPGTIASVALYLAMIAVLIWQFGGVVEGGAQIQVLNPNLARVWRVAIVALLVMDIIVTLAVWRIGRWTPIFAASKVIVNVVGTAVVVSLLLHGDLLVPDLPQELAGVFDEDPGWTVPTGFIADAVVLIAVWESVVCVRKARHSASAR